MKHRNGFDLCASRRCFIERYARAISVANTDDFPHVLIAWQWHNKNSRDPAGALIEAAKRMHGTISEQQAEQIIEEADALPKIRKADALGKYLGLTDKMRTKLQTWTIGASDVSSKQRKQRRKERDRKAKEAKRRARGAQTRAEYLAANALSRTLKAEGKSRATYYRQRAQGKERNEHDGQRRQRGSQGCLPPRDREGMACVGRTRRRPSLDPKSRCTLQPEDPEPGDICWLTIPQWLLEKAGL
jgi:hypothetical protein